MDTRKQFKKTPLLNTIITWVPLLAMLILISSCSKSVDSISRTDAELPDQNIPTSPTMVSDTAFKVFDGTTFKPEPTELAQSGLEYFALANTYSLWGQSAGQLSGTTTMPDKELVTELARKTALGSNKLSINIQHWSLTGSDAKVQEAVDRYLQVVRWLKEAEPNLKVGFFREMPIHKVSRSTKPADSDAYQSWIQMNERLQPLADEVDIFFPTLRTYTDDQDKWVKDAKEQIKLARRLNGDNPVYVTLWPKYHTYYDGYEDRLIEPDFWQLQLDTAREYADGVVISTPSSMEWDPAASWWQETKQYLEEMGKLAEPDNEAEFDVPVVSDNEFKVYDGTTFTSLPTKLTEYGLDYFVLGNSYSLWGQSPGQLRGTTTMPDKELVSKLAHKTALGLNKLSINIQHWPLTGSDTEVQQNVDRYLEVIGMLKEAEPDLKVGFYRDMPIQKIWKSTKPTGSGSYQSWIQMNERLQALADEVDIFYPTLRTYNDDQDLWVKDAKEQIKLARQLNGDNPVYAILWPKYHPYYDGYEDRLIEADFWQLQLDTARKYADGVVIATPSKMEWDPAASWWGETKEFLQSIGKYIEPGSGDSNVPVVSDSEFKVFDGTYYRPKPWALDNYGLSPIRMAYPPSLWGKTTKELEGTTTMPGKDALSRIVRDAASNGTQDVVVNIEHWPLEGNSADVQANMDRFMKVVDWVKEADPSMNVGFYGVPPVRSLWKSTSNPSSGSYQEWKQTNQDLKALADKVDAFYPSLYTFNDDRDLWVKEAREQIQMARELNEDNPVYVFLWPQYHPYYDEFGRKFIDEDFWNLQLETVRKYADGIVIWMPSTAEWDNSAPWWVATRKFMVNMGKVDWANK